MGQEERVGWGNALPWAIMAVAVLTACVGAVFAGLVPTSSAPLLVGVLLACSLPQLIGGIILFRRGETLIASLSGLFGTTITLGAALTLWQQLKGEGITPEVMGFFWITLFLIGIGIAIGLGKVSWFIMAGIAEVAVSFLFLGISALAGSQVAGVIGGWLILIFAAFCVYVSIALVWAEHFGRLVLPIGGPVFK
jgi:succinate-acetate transporter protein